jgi:hypothetical protein
MRGGTAAGVASGAFGGVVGTAIMSLPILAARRAGLMGEAPPRRIARAMLPRGKARRDDRTQAIATVILHFGFGAGLGALFGVLRRRLRLPVPAPVQGVAYALLVWLTSYQGWIPALGLLPPASRDRPDRPAVMILAHVIYGAILGAVAGRGEMASSLRPE